MTEIQIVSGDWLDRQVFPALSWVVPGIIPEGMSIIAGSPKVGKSWLTLHIALQVAHGGHALGGIPVGDPRPVLLLALEDGHRRLQARARHLLGTADTIPAGLDIITDGKPFPLIDTIAAWLDEHGHQQPLVVVDTFGKLRPPSPPQQQAYQADYAYAGTLKALVDAHPGSALAAVHHTNKRGAEGDFLDAVSGTQGIAGAADTTIVLRRNRQEDDAILSVTGRDVDEAEYVLNNESGLWVLAGGSLAAAATAATETKATRGLGDDATKVIEHVVAHGPCGPKDIATATGVAYNSVRTYLSRAVEGGRIKRDGRGTYTPVASVATVTNGSTNVTNVSLATTPTVVSIADRRKP